MRILVTGVSGFVGRALTERLLSLGHEVSGISRSNPNIPGLKFHSVDLSLNTGEIGLALVGIEAVFHTAAKVDMWGKYDDFYRVNVVGTQNLLDASQSAHVQYFIFTSSPSVVAGKGDLCGIDERQPYPSTYEAAYPATKAIAERAVLTANSGKFFTCALRPHLIYGPGDRNFAPLILSRAKTGRLRKIGAGTNLVDFSYIDDCVMAHLQALDTLRQTPEKCAGKAYFISQGEPYPLWGWITELLALHDMRLPKISVGEVPATAVAGAMELLSKLSAYRYKPLLTKFLIHQMSSSHYFSIESAKRDLGYSPSITVRDGLERTYRSS